MSTRELFQDPKNTVRAHNPLAERMRPRSLDEFVGQEDILAEGRWLSRIIQTDSLSSMIFWGPPGCGKTALATIIAQESQAAFAPFSAVLGGVKQVREIIQDAEIRLQKQRRRTILFIDEIHRMNKAQQDALLPHVERATVILIGATTENPSFEVIPALLSRSKVFVLKPLAEEHIATIVQRALIDNQRGLGGQGFSVEQNALNALSRAAEGDARRALNILEAAADYLKSIPGNQRTISLHVIEETIQHRTLLYDRTGEQHYNVVSAFIKSLRGSDPDAAVYWMTRMLEAGEDPRFILRRMIIFASEDIGNADPHALQLATAALSAHELVGLPESALCLSQTAIYLATAPKSNTALTTYTLARKDIREMGALPVPMHLRNAPTTLMKKLGYAKGYKYPHNFENHYVEEDYLPDELKDRVYYQPSNSGYERTIAHRLKNRRKKT